VRLQARQQHRERDREQQPSNERHHASVPTLADHPGGEPTRRHAHARDPNPIQGAERAAG
jgi:hypothetical protein